MKPTNKPLDRALAQLEGVLREQLEANRALCDLIQRKHAALRKADRKAVADCLRSENGKVQLLSELEKQRLSLVAQATLLMCGPRATEPLPLMQLAERIPEPTRGRLLMLRQELRIAMQEVQHESSVARRAADSLVHHMRGLVQTLGVAANASPTYGRTGGYPRGATRMSTFSATA